MFIAGTWGSPSVNTSPRAPRKRGARAWRRAHIATLSGFDTERFTTARERTVTLACRRARGSPPRARRAVEVQRLASSGFGGNGGGLGVGLGVGTGMGTGVGTGDGAGVGTGPGVGVGGSWAGAGSEAAGSRAKASAKAEDESRSEAPKSAVRSDERRMLLADASRGPLAAMAALARPLEIAAALAVAPRARQRPASRSATR